MLLTPLYSRVVWPLVCPVSHGGGYTKRLSHLRQAEKDSLELNSARQWCALQGVLRHAYTTSAFYRKRFDDAGAGPDDICTPADLARIPPLTRHDLRENLGQICSNLYDVNTLQQSFTGGTTDAPVQLRRDFPAVRAKVAIQDTFWRWSGYRPGDKVFWIWGARTDYPQTPSWRWRVRQKYLMRQEFAPASWLDPSSMEKMRNAWNRMRPRFVGAFPAPLLQFCKYLRQSGQSVSPPQGVIYTAEALAELDRTFIETTLGTRLFELYSTRDFGTIAGECEAHEGLHLNPSSVFVEYRPVGAGSELHELIVTDLNNYGMPLIRYKINDCVLSLPSTRGCPCGRGYPRMPSIVGRTADVLRLPNGAMVPGITLDRVVKSAPGLIKTQIVQETLHRFRLRYVAGPNFDVADLEALQRTLSNFFPPEVRFEFEPVADIEREPSGKTRFCISKLTAEERGL